MGTHNRSENGRGAWVALCVQPTDTDTSYVRITSLDLILRMIFDKEYKLRNSSLCTFLVRTSLCLQTCSTTVSTSSNRDKKLNCRSLSSFRGNYKYVLFVFEEVARIVQSVK
jgi:hypothetical protein